MSTRPHIIYILSDEHNGTAMSHTGDPNVRTPNMDRLADEGVSFTNAYSNCPICTPSRGTIFSGRHAHAGPVQFFFDVFPPTAPSTATMLREQGYHTAYFGKWHCGVINNQIPSDVRENRDDFTRWPHRTPEYHRGGFQDWYGFEINNAPFQGFYYHEGEENPRRMTKYQTDELTDMALAYLDAYDGDEPLFLVLSVEPPHFPLEAPEEYQRWDPAELETRPTFADSPRMREQLATYYAMVENLDHNLGRVMTAIRESDRFAGNTATIYFSDHGDFMGHHGVINRKENPHQESVRIPAIFHWPGVIPPQGSRPEMFGLVDMAPTTLGLIGVEPPAHVQGADFSPALRDDDFTGPDAVLLEMCGNPRWGLDFLDWRGVVTEGWKYAHFETGHEMLFDLNADPHEQTNLAETNTEMRDTLKARLLELLRDTREPYYDVLIEHGVQMATPVLDVSGGQPGGIAPTWDGTIQFPDS